MRLTILMPVALALLLAACGRDEPVQTQQKSLGAGLGESYKGMLDQAKQGVEQINAQMQRSDEAVRARNE